MPESSGIGFIKLSELEWQALNAFGSDGNLSLPYTAMQHVCCQSEATKVFRQLVFKGLIVTGCPYKLTEKGKRLLDVHSS